MTTARVDLSSLDSMRLSGDEDCGVGLECNASECWRGGMPLAYYCHPDDRSYLGQDAVRVHTIGDLIMAGIEHRRSEHGEAVEDETRGGTHG